MSLLERVLPSCRQVAERSRQVRIAWDRLPAYAERFAGQRIAAPPPDPAFHLLDRGAETLAFFLILDAVNFGSGWFPHLRKVQGQSGYYTIAGALTRWCRREGVPSAETLQRLTPADCLQLFDQAPADTAILELMGYFSHALNELGTYISEKFAGDFTGPVRTAGGDAVALVEQLASLPGWRDVALYDGEDVVLLKRAQIAVADLHLAFGGRGYGAFANLDRLTLFADNLVPHVLRLDGVLHYDPALLARIETGGLIAAGSPEEVEIRACAVTAVDAMVSHLHSKGHDVTAMAIDGLLWHRGQDPAIKAHPRHRTRTIFY